MRGNVLCDAIAAAFWSDPLLFYQLTLLEVELDIFQEPVSQAGLAYVHLAAVAVGRFDMIEFSVEKVSIDVICTLFWNLYGVLFSSNDEGMARSASIEIPHLLSHISCANMFARQILHTSFFANISMSTRTLTEEG